VNIIDFLKHPELAGRVKAFSNLSSWSAWLVFLKAVFALPLHATEEQLFRECTGRKALPVTPVELAVAIIGRRGGKSITAALLAVFLGCFKNWRTHLGPGELGHIVVVAQTMRSAKTVFNYIRGIFRAVPALEEMITRETADEIELQNNIVISVWPSSFRSIRGITIVCFIGDEIDFWWQEGPHQAEEVIASIRPAMINIPGAMVILISSPYSPIGYLYKLFDEHYGHDDSATLIWKAASIVMNPTLSEAKIARAIADDPERGRAEYEAEWRTGIAAALDPPTD